MDTAMNFFRNRAFWILSSAIALYWFTDFAIGTPRTRDSVDLGLLVVSVYMTGRLFPLALDKFLLGGTENEWRMLMGNALFWAGIAAQRTWALSFRWLDRPEWMSTSPWNGFFVFWIFSAGVLCLTASEQSLDAIPQTRIYAVVAAGAAGVLIGLVLARQFGLAI